MDDFTEQARRFKALGDENRLLILRLLQDGELCACKLLEFLHMSQSTLSYHMKILCECGLVNNRQEGKWAHYSISAEGGAAAVAALQALTVSRSSAPACGSCDCEEA